MALTVTINLAVPDLQDNGIAFANAAAWKNYWSNIDLTADFDAINNTTYTESAYDNALSPATVTDDFGAVQQVIVKAQLDSLLLAYQTLNANYKTLLNSFKNAGLLINSI